MTMENEKCFPESDASRNDILRFHLIIFPSLNVYGLIDHFCGLVVRVPGYRSRCPGSILGATRFSKE
jgi:hypothetical protein